MDVTNASTNFSFTTDNWLGVVTLVFTIIGGIFAFFQWRKSNEYKRSDFVREIIIKLRDDEDISFVMELIDWNDGFTYDGKFHLTNSIKPMIEEKILFQKIDKTLSHFSYVCYLHKNKIISNDDMAFYEYALRRLVDNPHIRNYLYSLFHWSNYLNVRCSFTYLIKYALKKGYLYDCFRSVERNEVYSDYLGTTKNVAISLKEFE